MQIYEELVARGLIAQVTNEEEIRKMVNEGKAVFYTVFDFHFSRIFCSFNRGLGLNDFVNSSGSMDTTFSFLN